MAKRNLILTVAIFGTVAIGASQACAGGFGGLGGLIGGNGNQGGQNSQSPSPVAGQDTSPVMSPRDVEASYSELNIRFYSSMRAMLMAQSYTIAALGDKARGDALSSEAASLEGKNDLNTVSRAISISQDASTEIDSKMGNAAALNAESKATLAMAVPYYTAGMIDAVQLPIAYLHWVNSAKQTIDQVKSNPMMAMGAIKLLREVVDVAQVTVHLPGLISAWSGTTHNFVQFSHNNKVDTGDLASKI